MELRIKGLLNTSHGQVAVGWLVLEDLIAVLILEPLWQAAGLALLKTGAFAALMVVAGTRVIPWFLLQMAHLRSRELFIVEIVVITVGTALGASSVFGISLALGAFLAGVVVSESALSHQVGAEMVPFLFRALPWLEAHLWKVHAFWSLLDQHGSVQAPMEESLRDHVVVIGCGRVGQNLVNVLGHLSIPRLEVEQDIGRVTELQRQAIPTLYGDAANSDILSQVHLKQARAVIVTLPDEAAAAIVVATARTEAPHVPIIVRASTKEGVHQLFALGAQHVIYPELEGGLEMVRETLGRLDYLESNVQEYTDAVRRSHYDLSNSTDVEQYALEQMLGEKKQDELASSH